MGSPVREGTGARWRVSTDGLSGSTHFYLRPDEELPAPSALAPPPTFIHFAFIPVDEYEICIRRLGFV